MIELYVYSPARLKRVCGLVSVVMFFNSKPKFYHSGYGVDLRDALRCASELSHEINRKIGVTGDIALFRNLYPNVKGSIQLH